VLIEADLAVVGIRQKLAPVSSCRSHLAVRLRLAL